MAARPVLSTVERRRERGKGEREKAVGLKTTDDWGPYVGDSSEAKEPVGQLG
jgi:hypothetical protein